MTFIVYKVYICFMILTKSNTMKKAKIVEKYLFDEEVKFNMQVLKMDRQKAKEKAERTIINYKSNKNGK